MPTVSKFVGRFFAPADFGTGLAQFVRKESNAWKPKGITVHHTGSPSLAQRPYGFTAQHMQNIKWGYENERGWSSGPHFFVDQNGIWVFVDPGYQGVHAVSFNDTHHGMEMLGNYDSEAPNAAVLANAGVCIRECMKAWKYKEFNFHRDDPFTKKTCPGTRISRDIIQANVLNAIGDKRPKIVTGESEWTETMMHDGRVYVPAKAFALWANVPKSYLYYGEQGLHIDGDPVNGDILIGEVCWCPAAEVLRHTRWNVTWDNADKILNLSKTNDSEVKP